MDPLILNLVSACTALVASIAGPIVTLAVARRQFSATVLSANRQRWIDTLRDMLAELISLITAASVIRSTWKSEWNRGLAAIESNQEMLAKLERMVLIQSKIRLLINPHEADHQQLHEAITVALKRLQSEKTDEAEIDADVEHITTLAQSILKREWGRVKRGT